MKTRRLSSTRGYTLAEICVALAIIAIVGGVVYMVFSQSTTLLAKNVSLNSSNLVTRSSLDRIFAELNLANKLPTLINADGSVASGYGPAAGVLFDRYIGGPYIVGNPGSGLAANATTFKLFYSTDAVVNPSAKVTDPPLLKDDVVIMDGATRALVSTCSNPSASFSSPVPSSTPVPPTGRMVTVTLQSNLGSYANPPVSSGTAIPWSSTTQQTAYVIHRKAFVVVPASASSNSAELRFYPDAETITNYNDPTKYVVLTRNIGTQTNGTAENLPFSLVAQDTTGEITAPAGTLIPRLLNIALRVEDQQYNKRLASLQAADFNTFLRIDTRLRPRNVPSL